MKQHNFLHLPLVYATDSKSHSTVNPYVAANEKSGKQIIFFQEHIYLYPFFDRFQFPCYD